MRLPLTNNPEEVFSVTIFGSVYNCRQLWNEYGFWTLDISDVDNNALALGVKLITQEFILRQYPQIPFDLRSSEAEDPGRNDLDDWVLEVIEKDAV